MLDYWLSVVGAGMHPAVSGHYRFRTERVYRRAAPSMIGKASPQEPITQVESGLPRNCAPFHDYPAPMCAAQYPFGTELEMVSNAGRRTLASPTCTQR